MIDMLLKSIPKDDREKIDSVVAAITEMPAKVDAMIDTHNLLVERVALLEEKIDFLLLRRNENEREREQAAGYDGTISD